jgi:hypothetical protein
MRRRLIVHIGMPRAGSSTLQDVLFRQRTKLARLGILYPVNSAETAGSGETASIYNHKLLSKSAQGLFSSGYFQRCHDEIATRIRDSGARAVVLSYEGWWRPDAIGGLERTVSYLQEKTGPLRLSLVAAVRNPVSFLHSLYKLDVVHGRTAMQFEDYLPSRLDDPRLSYGRIVAGVEAAFGPGAPLSLQEFEVLTRDGLFVANMLSLMSLKGLMKRPGIRRFARYRSRGSDFFADEFVCAYLFASRRIGLKRAALQRKPLLKIISGVVKDAGLQAELRSLAIPLRNTARLRIEQACHDEVEPFYLSRFGHSFRDAVVCDPDDAVQTEVSPSSPLGQAIIERLARDLPPL